MIFSTVEAQFSMAQATVSLKGHELIRGAISGPKIQLYGMCRYCGSRWSLDNHMYEYFGMGMDSPCISLSKSKAA